MKGNYCFRFIPGCFTYNITVGLCQRSCGLIWGWKVKWCNKVQQDRQAFCRVILFNCHCEKYIVLKSFTNLLQLVYFTLKSGLTLFKSLFLSSVFALPVELIDYNFNFTAQWQFCRLVSQTGQCTSLQNALWGDQSVPRPILYVISQISESF